MLQLAVQLDINRNRACRTDVFPKYVYELSWSQQRLAFNFYASKIRRLAKFIKNTLLLTSFGKKILHYVGKYSIEEIKCFVLQEDPNPKVEF